MQFVNASGQQLGPVQLEGIDGLLDRNCCHVEATAGRRTTPTAGDAKSGPTHTDSNLVGQYSD